MIGWIGGICMAICALPEVIQCLRKGNTGCSWGLLTLWTIGEVCLLIVELDSPYIPRVFNYIFNIFCLVILLFYKYNNYRSKNNDK